MKHGFRTREGEEAHVDPREIQKIAKTLDIDKKMFRVQFTRSSGPGGQHVNTTDSKAMLFVKIDDNPYLDPQIKSRLEKRFEYLITR